MGVKISAIELKEVEIVELEDGTFEKRFINPKRYPAFLTHRSLARGQQLGITKTSLISELIKMNQLVDSDGNIDMDNITPEQAEIIDIEKYLPVIYLGVIGANKALQLSYDDFLNLYHADMEKIMIDYIELVMPYIDDNPNEFKKGLEQSTKKKRKKANGK